MDLKKEAARKALTLIEGKIVIGLGAGSTIAYLVEFLQPEINKGLPITFVTSSFSTHQLLQKYNFPVQPIALFKSIDIYFDGCDQLDKELNALKSGGGIHTQEKLCASMAPEFVLMGDETKYVETFEARFPLVIELIPEAINFVPAAIEKLFENAKSTYRISDKKDGPVITQNGNLLLDVWFQHWPELSNINSTIKSITGIVETSLFYNLAHKAIIAGKEGVTVLKSQRAT